MNLSQPILLTPRQSCFIFGWFDQPRSTLDWNDVIASTLNDNLKTLTWRLLRSADCGITQQNLKLMQPDAQQWITRGLVTTNDVPDLLIFPVNPMRDLKIDLAELWSMMSNLDLTSRNLCEMGVSYKELVNKGLTSELMYYFNFTLAEWKALGMQSTDIREFSDETCTQLFQMPQKEVSDILEKFEKK